MTDLEDIVSRARAAIERSVTREKMRKALDEREAIIDQLLKKIEHMRVDNCVLAGDNEKLVEEVRFKRSMRQRMAQRGTA